MPYPIDDEMSAVPMRQIRENTMRVQRAADANIRTAESTAAMHAEMKTTARDAARALYWAKVAGVCSLLGLALGALSAGLTIAGWFR